MNDILRPVTPDGMIGYDQYNQLFYWRQEGKDKVGTIIGDPRGSICPICGRGWETTTESMADQYYHRAREKWLHETCFNRYLSFREYMFWHDLICAARIRFEGLMEITNEYGAAWNNPWYTGKLLDAPARLKLGTRKRVFHMEIMSDEPYCNPVAFDEFAKEDVTKGKTPTGFYIHAWTEAKALEYMKIFAKAAIAPKVDSISK